MGRNRSVESFLILTIERSFFGGLTHLNAITNKADSSFVGGEFLRLRTLRRSNTRRLVDDAVGGKNKNSYCGGRGEPHWVPLTLMWRQRGASDERHMSAP